MEHTECQMAGRSGFLTCTISCFPTGRPYIIHLFLYVTTHAWYVRMASILRQRKPCWGCRKMVAYESVTPERQSEISHYELPSIEN